MKFTEKYEILELLTSGRVSTFLARERATQEQAVVHTFECPTTFDVESKNSSILKHFASLAPSPAEAVTEVGFDEGSSSAYVVTRVPAASALQSWVRVYRSFPEGRAKEVGSFDENATAELSAAEVERLLRQSGRPKNQRSPEASPPISPEPFSVSPPAASSQPKGEFTRLFEEPGAFQRLSGSGSPRLSEPAVPAQSGSSGQHDSPSTNYGAFTPLTKSKFDSPNLDSSELGAPEPGSPEAGSPEAGSFTQQFFSGTGDVSDPVGLGNVPASDASDVKEPGAFTKEFMAITGKTQPSADPSNRGAVKQAPPAKSSLPAPGFGSVPQSISPASVRPAEKFDGSPEALKSSTGEFTSFFRGPFDQPKPSDKPFEYPDPSQASPPSSRLGDFTQMFGSETRLEEEETPSMKPSAQEPPKAPSFTQIFSKNTEGSARLGVSSRLDSDPLAPASSRPPIGSTASPSGLPAMFSGTVSPSASRGGGFPPSEPTSGPSGGESTFLNRAARNDATNVFKPRGADAPPLEQEAPSGPSDFTMFISSSQLKASLPPEPAIDRAAANLGARPPALPIPPMPSYAAPAPPPMPSAAAPPMPVPQMSAPRPPALAPGRPASYWPLITVFTVLFAIAALLVMYFALKH